MSAPIYRVKPGKSSRCHTEQNFTDLKRHYYALCVHNKTDGISHPQLFQRYPQAAVLKKKQHSKTCGNEP